MSTRIHKKLHFMPNLVDKVLNGSKTSTWRLWDDKDLQVGDIVDFLETGTERLFATVQLEKVIERKLGKLTKEEMEGHEAYQSQNELYKKFSEYYKKPVDGNTVVKIIWFKLQ